MTTKTLPFFALALLSALALNACDHTDTHGEVGYAAGDNGFGDNGREGADSGGTSAPPIAVFSCPSSNNRVAKAGDYAEILAVRPSDFWLGEGTCNQLSPEAEAILADVEQEAISACDSQTVESTCSDDCNKTEIAGTCSVTDSGADLLLEIPPEPGSSIYSCVYSFWAEAGGSNTVDCLEPDEPKASFVWTVSNTNRQPGQIN